MEDQEATARAAVEEMAPSWRERLRASVDDARDGAQVLGPEILVRHCDAQVDEIATELWALIAERKLEVRWYKRAGYARAEHALRRLGAMVDAAAPGDRVGTRAELTGEERPRSVQQSRLLNAFKARGLLAFRSGRHGGGGYKVAVPPAETPTWARETAVGASVRERLTALVRESEERVRLPEPATLAEQYDVRVDDVLLQIRWVAEHGLVKVLFFRPTPARVIGRRLAWHCAQPVREALMAAARLGRRTVVALLEQAQEPRARFEHHGSVRWFPRDGTVGVAIASPERGKWLLLGVGKRGDVLFRPALDPLLAGGRPNWPASLTPERQAVLSREAHAQTRAGLLPATRVDAVCQDFVLGRREFRPGLSTVRLSRAVLTVVTFPDLGLLVVTGPAGDHAGRVAAHEANELLDMRDWLAAPAATGAPRGAISAAPTTAVRRI